MTPKIREYERAYRRDGEALTVGELLPEFFNADACFVPGDQAENARSSPQRGTFKSPRQGYLLFSDSFDQLRPNLFWHELFHALQHENGLYQAPHYQEPTGFCKREMEASQFVIDHATLLKANVRDHMGELRVWSLRFAEYLQARKPQQTLLA